MALLTSNLCYAQNDTPMEVLVNIAYENARYLPQQIFSPDDRNTDYLHDYLDDYIPLKLDKEMLLSLVDAQYEAIELTLPFTNGEVLTAKLINHDIRAEGFSIIDLSTKESLPAPKAAFYRGTLDRKVDALAGVSFFEENLYGIFASKYMGNIALVPDPINPGDGENYILYADKDLKQERQATCDADHLSHLEEYTQSAPRSNVYSTCGDVEIYLEATNKLYKENGSNTTTTTNFVTAFFNNSAILFRNEGIYTSIKKIGINTLEDGYTNLTSSFENLNRFGDITRNNYQQYGAELAHLVDYDADGLGGAAWKNAMCSNYFYFSSKDTHHGAYAYSSVLTSTSPFSDFPLAVFVFTHEMGHNLGSQHTQWCGWEGGAIDDCATVENGPCNAGPTPSNGGTIMSYCHTKPAGINFSAGFGEQPGNEIRSKVASKTCVEEYLPSKQVATAANQTVTANRECTDEDGWTSYYFDNATADENDDLLLLSVLKGSEDIGNLDDGSLRVQIKTSSNAGNGSTAITSPGYNMSADWHVMNRWFELLPTEEPSQPVTVRFPYTNDDLVDVMINQPEVLRHTDLIFYKVSAPGDPNPDNGHQDVSSDDIIFYTNSDQASLDTWNYVKSGSIHFAEFQVTSFSGGGGGFTQNVQSALPVEIKSFEAEKTGEMVSLRWLTSVEVDNDFFTIERSSDGINFSEIGKVLGNGSSVTENKYEFFDRKPVVGLNYYRLKQTDYNGSFAHLGIRTVDFEDDRDVSIYPNPLHTDLLSIDYKTKKSESKVEVYIRNIEGKLVFQSEEEVAKGNNTMNLSLGNMIAGIYMVQVVSGGEVHTTKLIKD